MPYPILQRYELGGRGAVTKAQEINNLNFEIIMPTGELNDWFKKENRKIKEEERKKKEIVFKKWNEKRKIERIERRKRKEGTKREELNWLKMRDEVNELAEIIALDDAGMKIKSISKRSGWSVKKIKKYLS